MQRLVVLGNGASGKSTFARSLGEATGIPVTELDELFWSVDLEPTPSGRWRQVQVELAARDRWILDGDLGPYDDLEPRLRQADAVVLFDLPTWRCAWRAVRRSRERIDFWRWLLSWRRRYRPQLVQAIRQHAGTAELHLIRRRRDLERVTDALIARADLG